MKDVNFDVTPQALVQLGGNLYKNIYGMLVEYISNSYDADASVVEVSIDYSHGSITIKDDGIGMSQKDLEYNFMKVGTNRRLESKNKTSKGRLVTGRKGLGKLACFGLFKSFDLVTIHANKKSKLTIGLKYDNKNVPTYIAKISEIPENIVAKNGTSITFSDNQRNIPDVSSIANSIAKRLNLMYESKEKNDQGFKIFINETIVDKAFRDSIVLDNDVHFSYSIPKEIDAFTNDEIIKKYFKDNGISGTIIARNKTVKIDENKGVVLFARGKRCQQASYFGINPANSYGYAHLYAEFQVDFIDQELQDNIGTDRTEIQDTDINQELVKNIKTIIQRYADVYDNRVKKEKEKVQKDEIKKFKKSEEFEKTKLYIDTVKNSQVKDIILNLIESKIIQNNYKFSKSDSDKIKKLSLHTFSSTTNLINEMNFSSVKSNFLAAYNALMNHLKNKYNFQHDGSVIVNKIFGGQSEHSELNHSYSNLNCINNEIKKDFKACMRNLSEGIVYMRNVMTHITDDIALDRIVEIEESKRFMILVDTLIELDKKYWDCISFF